MDVNKSERNKLDKASVWGKVLVSSGALLLLGAMLALGLTSCDANEQSESGSVSAPATKSILSREEILVNRANEVFSSTGSSGEDYPGNLITAQQLYSLLQEPTQAEKIYLLDTRPRNEWDEQGHIEGANWMQMQNVADPYNLAKLPKDKLIVCLSPTGHTAVQVATVLRWLGYNAVVLEYGYGAWMQGPGNQVITKDVQNGMSKRYPVGSEDLKIVPAPKEPVKQLEAPAEDELAALDEAAQKLLHEDVFEKEYPFNHIFADELYRRLSDPTITDSVFILDIRQSEKIKRDGYIK